MKSWSKSIWSAESPIKLEQSWITTRKITALCSGQRTAPSHRNEPLPPDSVTIILSVSRKSCEVSLTKFREMRAPSLLSIAWKLPRKRASKAVIRREPHNTRALQLILIVRKPFGKLSRLDTSTTASLSSSESTLRSIDVKKRRGTRTKTGSISLTLLTGTISC